MANRLPIPEDIQHLIEKRETAEHRSSQDRRRPEPGDGEPGDGEPVERQEESSPPTQATGDTGAIICPPERRTGSERRTEIRRQGDATE